MQGRLMLANYEEYECLVTEMSPGDMYVTCLGRPRAAERVIAYVDHLGRVEGNVVAVDGRGFSMSINATERKREKLAAQLTWLANKHELGLPEDRRHDRLTPRSTSSELTLEDGTMYVCRIMDLSLSGAAVDLEVRPPIGTAVRLGNMRGRIVRHFMEGVAIEFLSLQSRETLREFL
nr:PilZ domain-containing protein [Rhizobium rhizogenes]